MATALAPPLYSNHGMPHEIAMPHDDVPDEILNHPPLPYFDSPLSNHGTPYEIPIPHDDGPDEILNTIDHTPLPYFSTPLSAPLATPLSTPTITATPTGIIVADIPACLQGEIAARVQRTIRRFIAKETCPTPAPAATPKKAPRPKLSQADPRYDDLRRRTIEKAKEHARELLGGSMLTEEQERLIDNVRLDATFRTHENPENPTHYDITLYYGELAPVEDTRYKVHSSHALGRGALSYPIPLSKPSPKRKRFSPPADAVSA